MKKSRMNAVMRAITEIAYTVWNNYGRHIRPSELRRDHQNEIRAYHWRKKRPVYSDQVCVSLRCGRRQSGHR